MSWNDFIKKMEDLQAEAKEQGFSFVAFAEDSGERMLRAQLAVCVRKECSELMYEFGELGSKAHTQMEQEKMTQKILNLLKEFTV